MTIIKLVRTETILNNWVKLQPLCNFNGLKVRLLGGNEGCFIILAKSIRILRIINLAECIGICIDSIVNFFFYVVRNNHRIRCFCVHEQSSSITLLDCNLIHILLKSFLLIINFYCGLIIGIVIGVDITMVLECLTYLESRNKHIFSSCFNLIVEFLLKSSLILACERCDNSTNSDQTYCWDKIVINVTCLSFE